MAMAMAVVGAGALGLAACSSTTTSQTTATTGGTSATSAVLRPDGSLSTAITSGPATGVPVTGVPVTKSQATTGPTTTSGQNPGPTTTGPTTTGPTTTGRPTDPARVMTGRLVAAIDQSVELGGGSRLVVTGVNDSRCPKDVMCASAGELEAEVRWTDANGQQLLQPKWSYQRAPVPVQGADRFVTISDTVDGGAVLWILDDPCAPVEGEVTGTGC